MKEVNIPLRAIPKPLTAPLSLSSWIIFAVPSPWEVTPIANPRATLSFTPNRFKRFTPTELPRIPVIITNIAVRGGIPPICSLTPMAIGVVTLLEEDRQKPFSVQGDG